MKLIETRMIGTERQVRIHEVTGEIHRQETMKHIRAEWWDAGWSTAGPFAASQMCAYVGHLDTGIVAHVITQY